jgi:Helix-turn-helix domain
MKKLIFTATTVSIFALSIQLSSSLSVYAAGKVDCDKIMSELNSGKGVNEVAKEMGVARRSVRRCRRHYGSEGESKMGAMPTPAAPAPAAPPPAAQ